MRQHDGAMLILWPIPGGDRALDRVAGQGLAELHGVGDQLLGQQIRVCAVQRRGSRPMQIERERRRALPLGQNGRGRTRRVQGGRRYGAEAEHFGGVKTADPVGVVGPELTFLSRQQVVGCLPGRVEVGSGPRQGG